MSSPEKSPNMEELNISNNSEEEIEAEPKQEEEPKPNFDAAIVFGHIERELPEHLQKGTKLQEGEKGKVQEWRHLSDQARMRCAAAAELYNRANIGEIIVSGGIHGKTGDNAAEDMKNYLVKKFHIPEQIIRTEDKSGNTLENLAHSLNRMDEVPDQYQNLAFISSGYHLPRIKQIAKLFNLEGTVFSAEEMMKLRGDAHTKNLKEKGVEKSAPNTERRISAFLEKNFNPNNNERYRNMLLEENQWTRGLEEMPEYWIPNVAYVNGERLRSMIQQNETLQKFLEKEFSITVDDISNMEDDKFEKLRQKLLNVKRKMPPEEWREA